MAFKPFYGKRLKDIKLGKKSQIDARTVAVPIIALTMASLLFVYSRSSIYAAKRNAERHRMADGGQISWRNESKRRHGVLDKPEAKITLKGLFGLEKDENAAFKNDASHISKEEAALKARRVKRPGNQG